TDQASPQAAKPPLNLKSLLANANRGWAIVVASFLSAGLAIGASNYAFGFFIEPLEREFGWSRTHINASLSLWALGSVTAPVLGRLMDRYGSRPVMVFSLALMAVSFLLRPLMTHLWHWYALSVFQFLCFSGAALLPAGRLVGLWFPKTRGRVMGLTMMGNNFGGLVVPPIVGAILVVASWQTGYLVLGLATVVMTVVCFIVVREPRAGDRGRAGERQGPAKLAGWTVKQALRARVFYVVTLAILLGNFVYSMILSQVYTHLTNEQISAGMAAGALSAVAACGMGGKFVFGAISERLQTRHVMMVSFGGQIIGMLLLLNPSNLVLLWIGVPIFGMCMGAFGALSPLLVQEGFGMKNFGSIMGFVNLATVVSFSLGPIIAGLSFDLTGGYTPAFLTMIAMLGLGIVLLTQARVKPVADA
ncbi:MAG: MFS transporter, partial [SAR202 cluster bacterium]|nr:MFS transporter [SAR202 cluster bacterium]